MKGAIARANELVTSTPERLDAAASSTTPANIADPQRRRPRSEILADFPEGLDYLITGVGTGGHITGVSEVLKETMPALLTYAVEPVKSPVISGGAPGPHRLQGIGAGFIPANLHTATLDGSVQVTEEDAFEFARRAAREEGIFIGASSGASLAAVSQLLPSMPDGARVLTFCYDTGERYLSVDGLFPVPAA